MRSWKVRRRRRRMTKITECYDLMERGKNVPMNPFSALHYPFTAREIYLIAKGFTDRLSIYASSVSVVLSISYRL